MGILRKSLQPKAYTNRVVGPGVDISRSMQTGFQGREINSDYENIYPTAVKAEQAFAKIRPYAIDDSGSRIDPPHALQKLYRPNKSMGAYRFRLALAASYLTKDNIYIRVHYQGGEATPNNITGFTFIEHTQPSVEGNEYVWHLPSGTVLTDKEVLTIPSGVNPYYVSSGFSSARAIRRWTNLDDYIVDYQSSFFRNGAIPAGQFVITAPTTEEYENIKQSMKDAHRGADKSNNVVYSHRPTDEDGQPNAPTVEWISYEQKNKDLAVKDLADMTMSRIESSTGVPKQITGQIEDSHYNGVRLAEYITTEYVARPMAMEIWDAFTHELNRVTGGLGYAFTFDLSTPVIADEELVEAQRKTQDVQTINVLRERGVALENIVEAMDYPKSYLKLEEPIAEDTQEEVTTTDEDLPVQDPELRRFGLIKTIKSQERETESEAEEEDWRREVRLVAEERLEQHIDSIIAELPELVQDSSKTVLNQVESTDEEDEAYKEELFAVLLPILATRGEREYDRNVNFLLDAGFSADGTSQWETTQAVRDRYDEYLGNVATSYNTETAENARRILSQAQAEGLPVSEIRGRLNDMKELDGYRATRLARTEVHRTQATGSVESMKQIKDETGYTIKKIWRSNPTSCEYCKAMEGTTVDVEENFVNKGDNVHGVDGGEFTNDFVPVGSASLHPNDTCRMEYEIEGDA